MQLYQSYKYNEKILPVLNYVVSAINIYINLQITNRMKSVNIKKYVRFGKDMLVFNIKQVHLYNFWIDSKHK